MSDLNRKKQIEQLVKFWYDRNPVHELNADSGEDMFWGTVLAVFNDMQQANGVSTSQDKALHKHVVIKQVCTCKNAEIEKNSSIPVYCHNCNAYVKTVL